MNISYKQNMFAAMHLLTNVGYNLSVIIEVKDCSRSKLITCDKQVLISPKRCKIETRLLQTTYELGHPQ